MPEFVVQSEADKQMFSEGGGNTQQTEYQKQLHYRHYVKFCLNKANLNQETEVQNQNLLEIGYPVNPTSARTELWAPPW